MRCWTSSLFSTTALTLAAMFAFPYAAYALPEGGVVSAGTADMNVSGNVLNIVQNSDKAIIDWGGFDIHAGETTQFHQPSATSLTVNRVNSTASTHIDGNLQANGNVVIINQNGVAFGKGAKVDVNSLIATTANSNNETLLREGVLAFDASGNPDAAIINEGEITARDAGLVGFVAPNVINAGKITAKLGRIQLASGDTATVDLYGDGLMQVAVSDKITSQLVANTASGSLHADGGRIAMTAAAGREIVNSLIGVEGDIRAQTVAQKNGEILISAEGSNAVTGNIAIDKGKKTGNSTVLVAGVLDASGRDAGERGGRVSVFGDEIALLGGTVVDVSGDTGKSNTTIGKALSADRVDSAGGSIKIGGDYLGQGNTPTAKNLYVDKNAYIFNDSLTTGDAGRSIFWSDNTTDFKGNIFARALGGQPIDPKTGNATLQGNSLLEGESKQNSVLVGGKNESNKHTGNGGFVETSGHKNLNAGGYVDLTASNGDRGTYFLDPTNITIYGNVDPAFQSTDGSVNLATNLKLWLDGNDIDGDGVSEDSAETGLFSGIGNCGAAITCVGTWRDKSGNGSHATQTIAADRPQFTSNGQNGLDVLSFNGVQTLLGAPPPLGARSAFATYEPNAVVGGEFFGFGRNAALPGSFAFDETNFDGWTDFTQDAVFLGYSGVFSPTISKKIAAAILGLTSTNIYKDGLLKKSGAETFTNNTSNVLIGAQFPGSGFASGTLSEALLYNTALTTNPRNLIEQYQSAKWGIELDPLVGAGTEIAEATAHNAALPNDAATNGYSVFTTRYLERLSQSADISLQASNNITLDLKGDTLNFIISGRSLSLTAGNQITTASAGNITTTNGAINLTGTNGILFNHAIGLNSGTAATTLTSINSPVTFNDTLTLGGNTSVNAGTGTVSFVNTVNGAYNLTTTGQNITFANSVGNAIPLGTVFLTSTNSLVLLTINAGSILARTTGAAGDITIPVGKTLTATGAGNALTLAATRNIINNAGAGALSAPAGRWLLYSTNPTDTVGEQLLASNFNRYNCTYTLCNGGVTIPMAGNGLMYSFIPSLTITGLTSTKIADGNAVALLTGTTLTGVLTGDTGVILDSSPVTGTFADSSIGTAKPITLTGLYTLTGTNYGYTIIQPTGVMGSVTAPASGGGGGGGTVTLPPPPITPSVVTTLPIPPSTLTPPLEATVTAPPPLQPYTAAIPIPNQLHVIIPSTVEITSQISIPNRPFAPIPSARNVSVSSAPLDINADNTISRSSANQPVYDTQGNPIEVTTSADEPSSTYLSVMNGMLKIHPALQKMFDLKEVM